jgi:TolB-like protein/DNA-binding winged helix-turn-helix (wHTH) protein/Tfp pilus assembly protein PilF
METNAGRNDAEITASRCVFLGYTLDTRRQLLLRGTESLRLRPRSYDVLLHLARNAGRRVSKQELMDIAWKDVAVTDDSLVQCLMEIRRALGDAEHVVETVRGRGYLFNTEVSWTGDEAAGSPAAEPAVSSGATSLTWAGTVTPAPRSARLRRAVIAACAVLLLGIGARIWTVRSRNVAPPDPGQPIRAIAVLPLENLSHDPDQEYFADGMTDDLITELSKISALRVISRTSVMPFKQTRSGPSQIARQLGVDALVTGTVLRSAERVRVSAQVIQISPEKNLWAERYERPLGDVVLLQGMLAREIADAIRVKLTPQEEHRVGQGHYVDEEAREAQLKGRYYWNKRTEEATWKAIGYFQLAIARDRTDARAYAGLADSYLSLALVEALQEAIPPNEGFPKAREAVTRALKIDETLGEAHATLGHIHFQYDRDWAGAEREFKRAIELNPNYANAHLWYALSLMWTGRRDEAVLEVTRAQQLDPLLLAVSANVGFILAVAHRYDEAIAECRKTVDLDPNFPLGHYRLGQIYTLKGAYPEAIAELEKAVAASRSSPRATAELGLAHALNGNRVEALRLVSDLITRSKQRYVSPFDIALIYAGLRDPRTWEWLQRAERDRSPSLNFLVLSPAFANIRTDPRYAALVQHIGLRP